MSGASDAVEGITKSVALEIVNSGIRVNAVAPGPVDTGMLTRFTGTAENKAALVTTVPMGRLGLAEQLANAIVFIASDEASFITGHILNVDGGRLTDPVQPTMSNLSGKTALITGASRGIGQASALALAKAGAQVLVHYNYNEKEADAVVAEIRNAGGRAEKVGADLRQADGPHLLAKQVRAIVGDRLDILAANAGHSKAMSIEGTTIEDFDNLFAVNVRAPFFLVQQLLPRCARAARSSSRLPSPPGASVGALSAYATTKGAIDTLVKHFASVLGSRGIRVNAIAPGAVDTDMSNFTRTEAGGAKLHSGCRR